MHARGQARIFTCARQEYGELPFQIHLTHARWSREVHQAENYPARKRSRAQRGWVAVRVSPAQITVILFWINSDNEFDKIHRNLRIMTNGVKLETFKRSPWSSGDCLERNSYWFRPCRFKPTQRGFVLETSLFASFTLLMWCGKVTEVEEIFG